VNGAGLRKLVGPLPLGFADSRPRVGSECVDEFCECDGEWFVRGWTGGLPVTMSLTIGASHSVEALRDGTTNVPVLLWRVSGTGGSPFELYDDASSRSKLLARDFLILSRSSLRLDLTGRGDSGALLGLFEKDFGFVNVGELESDFGLVNIDVLGPLGVRDVLDALFEGFVVVGLPLVGLGLAFRL